MSKNIENVKALINTFVTGDSALAASLLDENYIQHNLAYPTGSAGFIGAVEGLAQAPVKTTAEVIRAFEDGDKVFVHVRYNFAGAGEQAVFDILRINEDGKIAEHWDNMADVKAPNPSGHTQFDGVVEADNSDTEETRRIVSSFVADVLRGENPAKTADYFDGDNYIQHNPDIADGLSGLTAALTAMAEQGVEMVYNTTHQVLAQGNFALAVSEGTFAGQPTAFYDLFRVENGFIAEHWDVIEDIATEAAHENGKF